MQVAAVWEAYYEGDMDAVAVGLKRLQKLNLHWYRVTRDEIMDMVSEESECY